ncbi:carboxylating nicotinate-nucleotide diphosphorylase [Halegenticoccus tardaugens]|uniref:carboxylating nicotinate-nucleotide diphosphorylase n=1 Tax=Halegenticoccus tardaugens TaxID=2071624 RepID=UPI00100B4595|nr:carboxylating nicotinate-nucleotide diphosphorylase [Halegenticoccus tardaugens]
MIYDSQIEAWVREDLGHHDATNEVPGETAGRLISNEEGIAAGLDAVVSVFDYLDCEATAAVDEGDRIDAGDIVVRVKGPARNVLRGERVAVNVAGHASGIATKTRAAVERANAVDDHVRIACTRKTTPGLRGVEKCAVVAGGGDTHRLDLSHMVMVKDNHVAEMGLEAAVEHFRDQVSFATKIDVEVEDPADGPRAAKAGADVVLLDNMTPAETGQAVDLLGETVANLGREILVEASGGITVDDVADYAATGVDVISMGSLTHSAPSLDYSFRTG